MASIKDIEQVADDLENLVGRLRSEVQSGSDFEKLVQISDEISEHADNAAQTFADVNQALMSRMSELSGGSKRSGQKSGNQSQKAGASS